MRKILINTVFKLDILVAPQIVQLTRPSRRNRFFVIYYFIHKHMLHYNPHDNTLRTLWFCSLTFPLTCTDRFCGFAILLHIIGHRLISIRLPFYTALCYSYSDTKFSSYPFFPYSLFVINLFKLI